MGDPKSNEVNSGISINFNPLQKNVCIIFSGLESDLMHLQWKEVFLCLYPIYTLETSFTSFSFICCLKKKKKKSTCHLPFGVIYLL